jgi:hypothetical protein
MVARRTGFIAALIGVGPRLVRPGMRAKPIGKVKTP